MMSTIRQTELSNNRNDLGNLMVMLKNENDKIMAPQIIRVDCPVKTRAAAVKK